MNIDSEEQKLIKINQEIEELNRIIAEKSRTLTEMEHEHKASIGPDTGEEKIILQIMTEDRMKEPVFELQKRVKELEEAKSLSEDMIRAMKEARDSKRGPLRIV
ncbi:MAG: hypothetical protein PHD72_03765 [Patescibacteria group bacterium]|nr:hypothetical protein [Patescibacteria group bacterium]